MQRRFEIGFLFITKCLVIQVTKHQLHLFDSPYSRMISRSSWTFWKACNVLYNSYLNWFWRLPLELYEKVPWSWVKILTKLGQNFTKCFVSWPHVLKIITWDPSTFGRSCVKQICRFYGDLQLSCWNFLFNHLASWW